MTRLSQQLQRPSTSVALWLGVWCIAGVLAVIRLRPGLIDISDLTKYYLPAARALARGGSPYDVEGYVYSPLVAVVLTPFANHESEAVALWPVASVALVVVSCWLFTLLFAHLDSSRRAAIFAVGVVTALYSYPLVIELVWGQTQSVILLANVAAVVAHARGRRLTSGLLLGVGAIVKTWPAALLVWLLRRPFRLRMREWAGVGVGLVFTVLLALAVDGTRGLADMIKATTGASDQSILAWSVWGIRDTLPGGALRVIVTTLVLTSVIALLVHVLWRPGDPALAFFNGTFVVLLLLPVSHYNYLLLALPAFWWWVGAALSAPRERLPWVVATTFGAWWVIAMRVPPESTAEFVYLVVGATFVVTTVSVVASPRMAARR